MSIPNRNLSEEQKIHLGHAEALAYAQFEAATHIVTGCLKLARSAEGHDAAVVSVMQTLATNYHATVLKSRR